MIGLIPLAPLVLVWMLGAGRVAVVEFRRRRAAGGEVPAP